MPEPTSNSKELSIVVYGRGHANYIDERLATLAKRFTVQFVPASSSRSKTIARFREIAEDGPVHVVLFAHPLNPGRFDFELLGPFVPDLRFLAGFGAGFDHVDLTFMNMRGIGYANTPTAVAEPTALTTIELIFRTVRASSQVEATVRRNEWRQGLASTPDVRDMTIGILGMGTIGKIVQRRLDALGIRTVYHNRRKLSPKEEGTAQYVTFDELIETSDVISIHCPLTQSTLGMISDPEFDQMKDGVFIINTARGAVVEEEALIRAMESEKVSRVGLDVFEREPMVNAYFRESERVALSPHWATHTTRTQRETEHEMLNNFESWYRTGRAVTPVNFVDGMDISSVPGAIRPYFDSTRVW